MQHTSMLMASSSWTEVVHGGSVTEPSPLIVSSSLTPQGSRLDSLPVDEIAGSKILTLPGVQCMECANSDCHVAF
jgi:hypothetical protein